MRTAFIQGDLRGLIIGYRFIKIANETMCRPIRALTEARGYATSDHMCVFAL